jgi:hypothetical protein
MVISLRISNSLLNNIINQDEGLKAGAIVRAKILEMTEEFILIDIKGHGITKATLESDLVALKGEEVSFVVKSIMDNRLELKPLFRNDNLDENLPNSIRKDNSISLLLKNFNIKETDSSVLLVESLMDYNVPINQENLNDAIKTLDKIIQLTNLTEEDKVILLSELTSEDDEMLNLNQSLKEEVLKPSTENIMENKQNISQEIIGNKTILEEDIQKNENAKEIILAEKSDIKNLLIVEKNDYIEKEDISSIAKIILGNNIDNKEELIKIISFFIKNNMKPSLNNIKNLKELNKDPVEFAKGFEEIHLLIDSLKNNKNFKGFKFIENNLEFNKKNVEKSTTKIEESKKIVDNIKENTTVNLKDTLKNLENKIDFLRDMNKDLSFLFLPINFSKKDLEGALTILKGKKNKNPSDKKTNIFINLNTNNLGNIKISCEAISDILSLNINIKKEDLGLFQSMEEQLVERIRNIGYNIDRINFIADKDIQIIDSMGSNSNPTYFMDIKV